MSYVIPTFDVAELNKMFYVVKNGKKVKVAKERVKKCKRVRPFSDSIKSGVTTHEPGTKGRVKDLAAFYAANTEAEVSAFEV